MTANRHSSPLRAAGPVPSGREGPNNRVRRRSPSSRRNDHDLRASKAFTLVEVLVVIIIIVILLSAVLVASTSVLERAKATNTRAVLHVVADAVEEFKRSQQANPTITNFKRGSARYRDRYGSYPPDELEVFTPIGLPGTSPPGGSLAPRKAVIVPSAERAAWDPMRFYTDGDVDKDRLEHRDQAAMIVAIETLSEPAAAILSRLPERNRVAGPVDSTGDPAVFLDRPGSGRTGPDGKWDEGDLAIRYIVDGWGVPISYLAQRDWRKGGTTPLSSNHPRWNEASTEIIQLNRGQPVIMSYGSNGRDQLTKEWMEAEESGSPVGESAATARASLVADFADNDRVDHPLNEDNVYVDAGLKERLAAGISSE